MFEHIENIKKHFKIINTNFELIIKECELIIEECKKIKTNFSFDNKNSFEIIEMQHCGNNLNLKNRSLLDFYENHRSDCTIIAIRRITDNEIFKLGDLVNNGYKIKDFHLNNLNLYATIRKNILVSTIELFGLKKDL